MTDEQTSITDIMDATNVPVNDDPYLTAGRAMVQADGPDDGELFEWHRCQQCPHDGPCPCAGAPYPSAAVRDAVDAVRAPLVAEVDRLAAELARWESGQRVKGLRTVESVPDGMHYAAELVRAALGVEDEPLAELMREAAMRLKGVDDAARRLLAEAVALRADRDAMAAEAQRLDVALEARWREVASDVG